MCSACFAQVNAAGEAPFSNLDWEEVHSDKLVTIYTAPVEGFRVKAFRAVSVYDATLQQMAATQPSTHGEFLALNGVGEKKLADYGDIFLEAIAGYYADSPA